jgi:hypothetical protein
MQANKGTVQKGVKHEIRAGVLGKITHAAVRRRSTFKTPHPRQVEDNVEVYNELDSEDDN